MYECIIGHLEGLVWVLVPVQGVTSISNTPEGTNTAGVRLIEAVRVTKNEGDDERTRSNNLRRRPIIGDGELIGNSFISKL